MTAAEDSRNYRARHRERLREEGRLRYQKNAEVWNEKKRAARAANPDAIRAKERVIARQRYSAMTTEQRREKNQKSWAKNRESILAKRRETRYGLSSEEYERMLAMQDGRCRICGVEQEKANGSVLVVDHCHATGKVRSLLCRECNLNLAFVEKRGHLFGRMVEYVEEHNSKNSDDKLRAAQEVIRADRGD